jgi:hypothetical protein
LNLTATTGELQVLGNSSASSIQYAGGQEVETVGSVTSSSGDVSINGTGTTGLVTAKGNVTAEGGNVTLNGYEVLTTSPLVSTSGNITVDAYLLESTGTALNLTATNGAITVGGDTNPAFKGVGGGFSIGGSVDFQANSMTVGEVEATSGTLTLNGTSGNVQVNGLLSSHGDLNVSGTNVRVTGNTTSSTGNATVSATGNTTLATISGGLNVNILGINITTNLITAGALSGGPGGNVTIGSSSETFDSFTHSTITAIRGTNNTTGQIIEFP